LAYAFVPFSALPFGMAAALELALLALALALALSWLGRELPGLPRTRKLLVQSLGFFPLFASLLYQQLTALFLLALVGLVVALRRRQDVRAGLWLGVFAVKPQLALGLGLYLLLRRRFRAAFTALAVAALFYAGSYAILPEATSRWLLHAPDLFAYLRQGGYPTWGQYGAFGSAALLLDALSPLVASVVGVAFSLGIAFALARLARLPFDAPGPLAAALTLALCLSPHLYFYDLGLLIVPFALLYSAGLHRRPGVRGALALAFALCFAGTFLSMLEVQLTRAVLGHGFALQLGVLAILLAAWAAARGGGSQAQAGSRSTSAAASVEVG
jgi:alpha-1,2-mannosyltransferase